MFNVSTGCEPFFMLSYTRKTESLKGQDSYYEIEVPIVTQYKEFTGNNNIPDYFVDSQSISWKGRVDMQAELQKYCDTAISSTVNLPELATVKDVKDLYLYAWEKGLKGVTIFRNNCKRIGVLTSEIPTTPNEVIKRPKELKADFHLVKAKGKQYIVLVGLYENKPYEIWAFEPNITINIPNHSGIITKKAKMLYGFKSDYLEISDLQLKNSDIEEKAATLYSSMLLRHNAPIKYVIKTAKKVDDNITSFSSALCRVLSKYMENEIMDNPCPECGGELHMEGGCIHCKDCGYSKCE